MEHPSKLEKNLESLLIEMGVLKKLREKIESRGEQGLDNWLQILEQKERELDDIQKVLTVLKTGFHPNKFNTRLNLNKKVIEIAKVVELLKESKASELLTKDDIDEPDSIETFIMEQERGKPHRYPYEKLMLSLKSSDIIGVGGFGNVYRGKIDNTEVAIKVLRENAGAVVEKQFMAEVRSVFNMSHRNLIKLHGFCFHPNMKALVYEYMENGSFDTILYKNDPSVPWEMLYDIATETGKGIAYLHESCLVPIIHYDIKAANVLLDSKYSPKVTDFGLAKMYKDVSSHVTQSYSGGTRGYSAPEVCLGSRVITYKCDIYSFGMMLFEVLRRKQISKDEDWYPGQVWESFHKGELDRFIIDCGIQKNQKEKAKTLSMAALWCTQFIPDNRPIMSTVVKILEGVMHLPSPPNPDPYNALSSSVSCLSHALPLSLASTTVSQDLKEHMHVESFGDIKESSSHKKLASTSNLNNYKLDHPEATRNGDKAKTEGELGQESEWVDEDEDGVYIKLGALPGGANDLIRVRFSRKKFSEKQAEQWWKENRARVYKKYNILGVRN